jgi:class 3 adenylate cyclase
MNPSDNPTPAPSSPSDKHTVVLIVDIVHSTALYESLGNLKARAAVGGCLAELSELVTAAEGRVIKSMGDGLLCTFPSAEQAVNAALGMYKPAASRDLAIRVGVDGGEFLEEGGDIFGDVVNTTSRIANLTKPDEVLISRLIRDDLPRFTQSLLGSVQPVMVKGKSAPLELYSFLEGTETGTMIAFAPVTPARELVSLVLSYGGATCTVDSKRAEVQLGREPGNDLVVANQYVSRHHSRIYYRGGKFVLVDQSANGTYLEPTGEAKIVLRREEGLLHGSGRIYLGFDPAEDQAEPVLYQLVRGSTEEPSSD